MKPNDEVFQSSTHYKALIERVLDNKKYFLLTILFLILCTFILNKYYPRKYKNSASLMVQLSNTNPIASAEEDKEFNFFGSKPNLDNEIGSLKSFDLINKTINEMGLEVSFFAEENPFMEKTLKGSFFNISKEYYKEIPFVVLMDKSVFQPLYLKFYVNFIDDRRFRLQAEGDQVTLYNYIDNRTSSITHIKIDKIYQYGESITDKGLGFKLLLKENSSTELFKNKFVYFQFNHPELLTLQYQENLSIDPVSRKASILKLSLNGSHPEMVTDFLNTYMAGYLDNNLKKKNNYANSTVEFIDNQISNVADSLSQAQATLQSFKTANNVIDLSFQGQQVFTKLNQLETEKNTLQNQQKYFVYLRTNLMNPGATDIMPPASMNVMDPLFTQQVTQLSQLRNQRSGLNPGENPAVIAGFETKIRNLSQEMLENVNNNLNTLANNIKELDYRAKQMKSEISGMPKTQMQLLGMERKYNFNDAIYTYLLQKRSDAQIAKAVNTPNYEIIEAARNVSAYVVAPRNILNYLIAVLLGFILPLTCIMIQDLLNNKIVNKGDIEQVTNKPVIGYIFHNYKKTNLVISNYPKSSISESFRTVRTNLQIMFRGISKQVILVTSSGSGDGKSFVSVNLASVFALLGKKTILIGFDLRRPAMYQDLGLNNLIGISSYLSNRAILEDIIQPTKVENLDFIPAGPIPPNPVELMGSNTTKNLIFKLKEIYDYIIIDTAPIGVVTDALFLMNYVDLNLYVVRQNFTIKEMFGNTLRSLENNKVSNIAVIVNDVYLKSRAYAYGYDSKYYVDSEDTSMVKTFMYKTGIIKKKKSARSKKTS